MIYFKAYELVPPEIYEVWGERALYFIDPRVQRSLDALRCYIDIWKNEGYFDTAEKKIDKEIELKLIVNNWKWGGDRKYSGFRPLYLINSENFLKAKESNTIDHFKKSLDLEIGHPLSTHKQGLAIDCICSHLSGEQLRKAILDHPVDFPFIRRLEGDVNWLHFDILETGKGGIHIFYEKG
jgi:hypothetical protein